MLKLRVLQQVRWVVLVGTCLLVTAQPARATSDYDQIAYDYIQEGWNIVFDEYETYYWDGALYIAYYCAANALDWASYALDTNDQDAWFYAYVWAEWAATYASESPNETGYGYDALSQGALYAAYAYIYYSSLTDFFDD